MQGAARWGIVLIGSTALAACSRDATSPSGLARCSSRGAPVVSLAAGAYTTLDVTADSGCVTIGANASATDSAEYLALAQSASGTPGDSAAFTLQSIPSQGLNASISAPAFGQGHAHGAGSPPPHRAGIGPSCGTGGLLV